MIRFHPPKSLWLILVVVGHSQGFRNDKYDLTQISTLSFTEGATKVGWSYIKCLQVCQALPGCNAFGLDNQAQTCQLGWVNLGHESQTDESRMAVYVDQDALCSYKRRKYAGVPQRAVNGKIFYLLSGERSALKSRQVCHYFNLSEPILRSREDFDTFIDLIGDQDAHIGLYYHGTQTYCLNGNCWDEFKWADGEDFHWSINTYKNMVLNSGDLCMRINPSGSAYELQDNECTSNSYTVCQYTC